MISRTQLELLNSVVNEPEVLSAVAPGRQCVDLSMFFDKPGNLIFGNEHGLLAFAYLGDGIYEGHYLFTNTMNRRLAMLLARRALRVLFTRYGASAIVGVTPRGNLGARVVNRALGLQPVGSATDTAGRPCIKYRLEKTQWEASLH